MADRLGLHRKMFTGLRKLILKVGNLKWAKHQMILILRYLQRFKKILISEMGAVIANIPMSY